MKFAEADYAYLLFLLPVLALVRIIADRRTQRAVEAFAASERLRAPLLAGASPLWSGLHFGLQILGLAFLIIALTRPQLGVEHLEIPQSGRSVFIAVDTSKSMLADDMAPNRLTRAKLAAQDLLEKLPGDRVGLVAFAGRAFLQAPLTTDHDAVRESIQALDHTTIPRGGSSLAAAIRLVLEIMEKTPGQRCGMVIFSDGQETDDGALAAAKEAAGRHLLILPVGMGTEEGSLVPDPDPERMSDYLRDERGQVIKARLEAGLLQQIGSITGARYIQLASQALTQGAVDSLLNQLDAQTADARRESRPLERYQWPLGLGLFCIILSLLMRPSFRRPVKSPALPVDPHATVHAHPAPALQIILALTWTVAAAGTGQAASDREVMERAREAYRQGDFSGARDIYSHALKGEKAPRDPEELHYGAGASAHQLKDFESAVRSFSEALRSRDATLQGHAMRGLATSLYDLGDIRLAQEPEFTIKAWTDACDHFEGALDALKRSGRRDAPEYKEIEENRDFILQRLEELKRQREQQKQQQKSRKQKQQQKGGKGEGKPEETEAEESDENQEPREGDQPRERDNLQKKQEPIPEGELRAREGGQQQPQESRPDRSGDQRNEKTGFTPEEARNQLRNYADDQKSAQYLMRRERPLGGKDY